MRGRWVEVDRERLEQMLDQFRSVETAAAKDGLSFGEAMRLLAGAHVPGDIVAATAPDWSLVVAGPWLAGTLAGLRDPAQLAQLDAGAALKATLRPYQQAGVQAASALQPRPGRVSRRRYGPRQDDAGAGAAPGDTSARGP